MPLSDEARARALRTCMTVDGISAKVEGAPTTLAAVADVTRELYAIARAELDWIVRDASLDSTDPRNDPTMVYAMNLAQLEAGCRTFIEALPDYLEPARDLVLFAVMGLSKLQGAFMDHGRPS